VIYKISRQLLQALLYLLHLTHMDVLMPCSQEAMERPWSRPFGRNDRRVFVIPNHVPIEREEAGEESSLIINNKISRYPRNDD